MVALAVPIAAGLVFSAPIGVIDSALVAPLGAPALGAVSLTGSVMLDIAASLYGFLTLEAACAWYLASNGSSSAARTVPT